MSSPSAKLGTTTPRRNLTGTARHVRDFAADVHSNIQRWNKLHLEGFDILKCISQETHPSNCENLQELYDKLETVWVQLNQIVENLGEIARRMIIVSSLHKNCGRPFDTWPAIKFGEAVQSVYRAYHKEVEVKRRILENMAHDGTTEAWKMLHLAGWVRQSLLPDNLTVLVESLLTESGHR